MSTSLKWEKTQKKKKVLIYSIQSYFILFSIFILKCVAHRDVKAASSPVQLSYVVGQRPDRTTLRLGYTSHCLTKGRILTRRCEIRLNLTDRKDRWQRKKVRAVCRTHDHMRVVNTWNEDKNYIQTGSTLSVGFPSRLYFIIRNL